MVSRPEITAVVCTYNRDKYLRKCLLSLVNQSLDAARYEIIVVDNASTDSTKKVCDEFTGHADFRYIYEPVQGLSKARNTGWSSAKSSYIGYLDDDAVADVQWLEKALWSFNNLLPGPDGLTGPISLDCETELPDWLEGEFQVTLGKVDWGKDCFPVNYDNEKIVGANCFFKKEILSHLGGFNEDLGRKKKLLLSGEETQLQKKIEDSGGVIWYHPDVSVNHFVPTERTSPAWFYKRYYWGGISDYIMAKSADYDVIVEPVDTGKKTASSRGESRQNKRFGQVRRLLTNIWYSTGIFSSADKVITSRIYMSYVAGWCVASFRCILKKDPVFS